MGENAMSIDRTKPTPNQLDQLQSHFNARSHQPVPMRLAIGPDAVLFAYVDNSNIWIEGQRIMAVRQGLARDARDAMRRRITAPWSYDFGRLYEIACPVGSKIGRSLLVGSRPPADDSVWSRARSEGFQVELFDRNAANKEKQVDNSLGTSMVVDCFKHMKPERGDMAVLVAGDGDYLPNVRALHEQNVRVRVVCWEHCTNRELRETADEFVSLDEHFDRLTLLQHPER
jgi:hypothetical protein